MKVSEIQHNINIEQNKRPASADKRDEKLWKASKDMEGVFLSYLIKSMEKTIPEGGLTSSQNSLAKMMFSSVLGKEMAENGGIGLAKHLYQALETDDSKVLERFKSEYAPDILYNLKLPEGIDE